jgi:hypothetical protein
MLLPCSKPSKDPWLHCNNPTPHHVHKVWLDPIPSHLNSPTLHHCPQRSPLKSSLCSTIQAPRHSEPSHTDSSTWYPLLTFLNTPSWKLGKYYVLLGALPALHLFAIFCTRLQIHKATATSISVASSRVWHPEENKDTKNECIHRMPETGNIERPGRITLGSNTV